MHCCSETLGTYIYVHDHALRFPCQACVAVCHGQRNHLIWARNNPVKPGQLENLVADEVLYLGNWPFFSFCPSTMASMSDGWSEPRFTKQYVIPAYGGQHHIVKLRIWTQVNNVIFTSHSASKKATEALDISQLD